MNSHPTNPRIHTKQNYKTEAVGSIDVIGLFSLFFKLLKSSPILSPITYIPFHIQTIQLLMADHTFIHVPESQTFRMSFHVLEA
jgi:hypothetical protein